MSQSARSRQLSDPYGLLACLGIAARSLPTEWDETNKMSTNLCEENSLYTRLTLNNKSYTVYAHFQGSRFVIDKVQADPIPKAPEKITAPSMPVNPPLRTAIAETTKPPVGQPKLFAFQSFEDPRDLMAQCGLPSNAIEGPWEKLDPLNDDHTHEGTFVTRFFANGKPWVVCAHLAQGVLTLDRVADTTPKKRQVAL